LANLLVSFGRGICNNRLRGRKHVEGVAGNDTSHRCVLLNIFHANFNSEISIIRSLIDKDKKKTIYGTPVLHRKHFISAMVVDLN